jgi:hypothetical protein
VRGSQLDGIGDALRYAQLADGEHGLGPLAGVAGELGNRDGAALQ